jgi:hypothetical protein
LKNGYNGELLKKCYEGKPRGNGELYDLGRLQETSQDFNRLKGKQL